MNKQKSKVSYIFLDESGKPEIFSKKGINLVKENLASKYLVIAAIRTTDQFKLQQAVTKCRLDILKNKDINKTFSSSYTLDSFHAQTDYLSVKEFFYNWINRTKLDLKIAVIVAEKIKAYYQLQQNPGELYATVAGQLLKRFLHTAEKIEVIFSRRDSSLKTRERIGLVVNNLRLAFAKSHHLDSKTIIHYYHNPHYTHGGLQIADYIAYAIFQVFERNNRKWYEIIKKRIGYIQDLFNKKSYSRSNPL